MKKLILIGIFVMLLLPFAHSGEIIADETSWWDIFKDDFFGLFGVEPALYYDISNHNPYSDKQEYTFKTSLDDKDKTFDYEVKVLSKSANIRVWLEYYESKTCKYPVLRTIPDITNITGGTRTYVDYYIERECGNWKEFTKEQVQTKILNDNSFTKIRARREWGECPKENEITDNFGNTYCEQRVDFIPTYGNRKYIEYATWVQDSTDFNFILSNTEVSGNNIILSSENPEAVQVDDTGDVNNDAFGNDRWTMANITITETVTIDTISVKLFDGESQPATDFYMQIMNMNADGNPDINTSFSASTMNADLATTPGKWYNFTDFNGTIELSAGNYAIGLWHNSAVHFYWRHNDSGAINTARYRTNDESWAIGTSLMIVVYTGTPFPEGNATTPGFGNGIRNINWGELEWYDESVASGEYRTSSDNSTWGNWANATNLVDLGVSSKYIQIRYTINDSSTLLTYSNLTYFQTNPPSIPLLNTPDNLTNHSSMPELNWDNSTDADGDNVIYHLEVDNDIDFSSPAYANNAITETANTTGDTPTGLTDGTYYWRVLAYDDGSPTTNSSWSEIRTFTYDTISPNIVVDIPKNITYNDIGIIAFNHTEQDSVLEIDSTWYSLNSGTNTTITENITLTIINGSNTINLWANDSIGNENISSVTFFINTQPTPPILYTPPNNSKIGNISIILNCSGSEDLEGDTINYEFYADTSNPPTTLLQNTSLDTYTYSTEGDIFWRCRANDNQTNSDYTDPFYFQLNSRRIHNASLEYESSVIEGSTQDYQVNVTINKWNTNDIDVTFNYNGTEYTAVKTIISTDTDLGIYEFERTITIPNLDGESVMEGFWNFTLDMNDGTTEYNATYSFTQIGETGLIFECDGTVNTTQAFVMNITGYYELNNTQIITTSGTNDTGFDLDIDLILFLEDISINDTLNLEGTNVTEYDICMSPPERTFNLTGVMEYTKEDYVTREYFFQRATLDNITNEIFLYFLSDSNAVKFFVSVKEGMLPFIDATVTISKYEPSTGSYKTVSVRKTDNIGEFIAYLDLDKQYQFSIVRDGISYGTINKKATCTEAPCEMTLQVEEATEDLWQGYYDIHATNVAFTHIFNHTTKVVTFTFNDLTGLAQYFRLLVTRVEHNQTGAVVCNQTLFTTAGTMTCNLTEQGYTSGDFYTEGFISRSPEKTFGGFFITLAEFIDALGQDGIFVALLIIVVIAMVGAWNPVVGIALAAVAVFMMQVMGFVAFGTTTVIIIFILAAIIIFNMGKT